MTVGTRCTVVLQSARPSNLTDIVAASPLIPNIGQLLVKSEFGIPPGDFSRSAGGLCTTGQSLPPLLHGVVALRDTDSHAEQVASTPVRASDAGRR